MCSFRRISRLPRLICGAALVMSTIPSAFAQGLYYREIKKDERIYVFNNAANAERFEQIDAVQLFGAPRTVEQRRTCAARGERGRERHERREPDATEPTCHYARTKAIGTDAVRNSNAPHLVLRTNWLYSWHSPNFVRSLVDQALRRDCVLASADQSGTPTSSAWLAALTAKLLLQAKGSLADWLDVNGGLLHATPLGSSSRVDIAEHVLSICRTMGLPVTARSVRAVGPGADSPLKDTYNCQLDCSRLATLLGEPLPHWRPQLTEQIAARFAASTPMQGGYLLVSEQPAA